MKIKEIISPEFIHIQIDAKSKKSLLEAFSQSIVTALPYYEKNQLFDDFLNRERLGSTAIGHGVAIPHARIAGNNKTMGAFIRLKQAINFDASDEQPVNIFFALVVPENSTQEHLSILAVLARFFRDDKNRASVNQAQSADELYEIFSQIN